MSTEPRIRWSNNQKKALTDAVRKMNAKITRETRKNPALVNFNPEKLDVKALRKSITSTKDLNNLLKKVDRAFKNDAFTPVQTSQGIKTTKYELNELKRAVDRINRARQKELKNAAPSTEKGTMGTIRENNLKPKKFNIDSINPRDWTKYKDSIEKQSASNYLSYKQESYKENYLTSIRNSLGAYGDELAELITSLDAEFVYNAFYTDPLLQIGYHYTMEESIIIAEVVLERWQEHIIEKV